MHCHNLNIQKDKIFYKKNFIESIKNIINQKYDFFIERKFEN